MKDDGALVAFQGKEIRRIWHNERWYFSVVDIVGVLTESTIPRRYWSDLKSKLSEEGFELYEEIVQLKLPSTDGKKYETDCADTEVMFRIIQSIPSPKAEPFKRWLAKVGYERVQEIENPELSMQRMREIYRAKGYSEDWIEKRVRGIAIRDELTNEWQKRGVKEDREYAILTAEISKATFGMSPADYKEFKRLRKENLRDHMTDLELIFSMLGERATTEIARSKNAQGFTENKDAATRGGNIAGDAREKLEIETAKKVATPENYMKTAEKTKRIGSKKK